MCAVADSSTDQGQWRLDILKLGQRLSSGSGDNVQAPRHLIP